MLVTMFHGLGFPPVGDPAEPLAKFLKGSFGMRPDATRTLATPGSSADTSTSRWVLRRPDTSNSKCPPVAIAEIALTLSDGDVTVTDGDLIEPSATLVYVPESKFPTTGKSWIWTLMLVGGRLLREIWAAVDDAKAGSPPSSSVDNATAAAAPAAPPGQDFFCRRSSGAAPRERAVDALPLWLGGWKASAGSKRARTDDSRKSFMLLIEETEEDDKKVAVEGTKCTTCFIGFENDGV